MIGAAALAVILNLLLSFETVVCLLQGDCCEVRKLFMYIFIAVMLRITTYFSTVMVGEDVPFHRES